MRTTRLLTAVALAGASLGLASTAHAADDASVSVLHGVPGATVDVYANGDPLLTDFTPGTLTDPVMLPAGSYDLKVTAADAGADGKAVVEAKDVNVPAGANITVVAHLSADGTPSLTPFVNDVSKIPAGQGRLTVRHVAAAPAVDVRAGGKVAFSDLVNPKQANAELPAGTVSADVVLAGTNKVAIGPADVPVKEGTNTIVYAWGSAADKNLKLAVQTVGGMHTSPGGVPAGTGGQAAGEANAVRFAAVGATALGAGALVLFTRRRTQVQRQR